MINYAIDPKILKPFVPFKTELDFFEGRCYVSLIGFMFLNTRLKGIPIPFHGNFEEVNLRFYVKHFDGKTWKRGAVFIKEIVPKPMISLVANSIFGEHYETRRMDHKWEETKDFFQAEYSWKTSEWNSFSITARPEQTEIIQGSEEEFISEHYWGYTKLGDQKTSEYGVEHPKWQVYETIDYQINVDFEDNYGSRFAFLKNTKPESVFLAEGSDIVVRDGGKI